ncbi:MAG: methylated-DNA--[protein]-cysteine S-methyltransferase [Desulfobacterales bacterium]|nr:methylated-DNA--[protein]-cysteine S-methyltransferase [Desulfobacterales bacterium]
MICVTHYQSPLGTYILAASENGLVCIKPQDNESGYLRSWGHEKITRLDPWGHLLEIKNQLEAYFAGHLRQFNTPLDLRGTSFQRDVWTLLCAIPWGETRSYFQVAEGIGRPRASRAVGGAVGKNPVSIVVPCHRVVGSNGTLTGYADGIERKKALLALEDYDLPVN